MSLSNEKQQPRYLSTKQIAKIFGLKEMVLHAMRFNKKGPPYYRFGRSVFYIESEVEEYFQKSRVSHDDAA